METSSAGAAAVGASASAPALPAQRRPRAKYKSTYDAAVLKRALYAVTQEGMSLRKAAAAYGVPKTTLADKIEVPLERPLPKKTARRHRLARGEEDPREASTAVGDGTEPRPGPRHPGDPVDALGATQPGRQPDLARHSAVRLTLAEERLIAAWAVALMELGVPPSKDEIYKLASLVVQKRCEKVLGKQWVSHWLRKYPSVKALDWEGKQASKRPDARLPSGGTAEDDAFASPGVFPSHEEGGGQGDDPSDDPCDDELDELVDGLAQIDEQGGHTGVTGAQAQAGMDVMRAAL